jgi:hemolysin III
MEPVFPVPTPRERLADAVVHGLGLAAAAIATGVLLAAALPSGDAPRLAGLGIYAAGLLTMLTCSALYNLTGRTARKALYQRFDHAAIFVMIAGSYTPWALVSLGGAWAPACSSSSGRWPPPASSSPSWTSRAPRLC